jgi:hypothetical protein
LPVFELNPPTAMTVGLMPHVSPVADAKKSAGKLSHKKVLDNTK